MRRISLVVVGILVLLAAGSARAADAPCPITEPRMLKLPVAQKRLAEGKPITIVAFGSSSTEGVGASAPDRTYPARLEAMLREALPGTHFTVLNRGVGGQTIESMSDRIDTDVLAVRPALVVWQAGANDAMGKVDHARFTTLLDAGVRRIVSFGIDVVLMDNQMAPRIMRADPNERYDLPMIRVAHAPHVSLFSRMGLMQEWHEIDPTAHDMIGPDGLHHTDRGYACVAEALSRAIVRAVEPPRVLTAFTGRK